MRADVVACHGKGYWGWIRKLGSPRPSTDLICGGAFARGLEIFRLEYYGNKLSHEAAMKRAVVEAITAYGDHMPDDKKANKGPERVVTALEAYFRKYPPDHDYIQPHMAPNGKPMVEFTFSITIPVMHPESGEPLIYAGRFDMVGTFNSQLIGVDEKTTGQLGDSWKNSWDLRAQFTGYTWAMQQYGFPVIGIMVRGVSFLSENSKVAWENTGHGFAESFQMRPDYMIAMWYEQLIRDLERFKAAWVAGEYDLNLSDACAGFSGCAFKQLCTASDPEPFTSSYAIRDWDPLAKIPEKQPEQKVETIDVSEYLRP
jgi:hypothetical protein